VLCSDPMIEMLADLGYCVVRLPRKNIQPLALLEREGRTTLHLFGSVGQHLPAMDGAVIPSVTRKRRVADISDSATGKLGLDVGLDVLSPIVGALGGSPLGIRTAYQDARSIAFQFSDVFEDSILPASLDVYLGSSEAPGARTRRLLSEGDLYIIVATLTSTRIIVHARGHDGADLKLNVPQVQGLVGATVEVSSDSTSASTLTYGGPERLVFGFKAVQVASNGGTYTISQWAHGELRALPGQDVRPRLLIVDDELLELRTVDDNHE
jgi:hypothetical protein